MSHGRRILVSGAGIAGLTLASLLHEKGDEVTLLEKSPGPRPEGYMIDFFGPGYEVAERLGLLDELARIHYPIGQLSFVDEAGREQFAVPYARFRHLLDDRHFNFMRGDLEGVLWSRVEGRVDVRFGTTIAELTDGPAGVAMVDSHGRSDTYDLVVGADGVHSPTRERLHGPADVLRFLHCRTAAYILPAPPEGLAIHDAFVTLTTPRRQMAVYPIRGGRLATFFVFASDDARPPPDAATARAELQGVFGDLGWIVPEVLAACPTDDLFFDIVAQVELQPWSAGHVTLVGDACQCVSLIAGQGASMAMTGAYVLAEALHGPGEDLAARLAAYEARMRPEITRIQASGRRLASWFVPATRLHLMLRDMSTRALNWPVAPRVLRPLIVPRRMFERS